MTLSARPHHLIGSHEQPSIRAQVRAGTGGDEAAMWAADLVRMFSRYAAEQGWKVQPVSTNEGESGGIKEAVIQVGLAILPSCPSCLYAQVSWRLNLPSPAWEVRLQPLCGLSMCAATAQSVT